MTVDDAEFIKKSIASVLGSAEASEIQADVDAKTGGVVRVALRCTRCGCSATGSELALRVPRDVTVGIRSLGNFLLTLSQRVFQEKV